jgi:hypothetical protein
VPGKVGCREGLLHPCAKRVVAVLGERLVEDLGHQLIMDHLLAVREFVDLFEPE